MINIRSAKQMDPGSGNYQSDPGSGVCTGKLAVSGSGRTLKFYQKLGYTEIGIVPCVFNGIDGVQLVLLEKKLGED